MVRIRAGGIFLPILALGIVIIGLAFLLFGGTALILVLTNGKLMAILAGVVIGLWFIKKLFIK